MRAVDAGVKLTGYCASVGLRIACCAYWVNHPFLAMYTYSGFDGLLHDRYVVHMLVKRTWHGLFRKLVNNIYEKCQANGYVASSRTYALISDSWKIQDR
jgi:hypothetical protein